MADIVEDKPFGASDWLKFGAAGGVGLLPMLFGGGMSKGTKRSIAGLEDAAADAEGLSKSFSMRGEDLFGPAAEYLKGVTSGNRGDVLAATMPERRRVIDQYATAKKSLAEFAPRSGGTAGAMTMLEANKAGDLSDLTSSARREGVNTSSQLGLSLQGLGLNAEALRSGDLQAVLNAFAQQDAAKAQSMGGLGEALGTIAGMALFL